jgi:hypothetical protein
MRSLAVSAAVESRPFLGAFAPPINPNSLLYHEDLLIRSLGHVVGGNRRGNGTLLRFTTIQGGYGGSGLSVLWSTQAKLEGIIQ